MEKHPLHIKSPELQTSPEVHRAVVREERQTGEKIPNDPAERIEVYMDRLENVFLNPKESTRERNLEMFKDKIYDAFIIKKENFPESYFELQKRIARERGEAIDDPNVQGILVRIDSPGGYPVASEVIANNLKTSPLPSVALIRESGTSGGYLVATGANTIIASPFSDVGGIEITMSYVDNWRQNELEGLDYVSLSSAKYKDYLDPNKPLTTEERSLIERDLKIWHDEFVKQVAENRDLPLEDVSKLADGSSMPGALALENMLIDSLGDQETARQWFVDALDLPDEEVWFCE